MFHTPYAHELRLARQVCTPLGLRNPNFRHTLLGPKLGPSPFRPKLYY